MARSHAMIDALELETLDLEELRDVRLSNEGTLRKSGQAFEYQVRLLDASDVGGLVELHEEIMDSLADPLLLYRRDAAFFLECIGHACVAGAYHDGRMIAYAAQFVPGLDNTNYGRDLGLEREDLLAVGHLAGSGVAPSYRGNRLQRELVLLRNRYAVKSGHYHMCGEVVPTNVISIINHLAAGFYLSGHRIDDFGDRCFILHRDLRGRPEQAAGDAPVEAPIEDLDRYVELVDSGLWGFEVVRREEGSDLRFARFS